MALLKTVENKIFEVENFHVVFKQNGMNVRSDRENIPQYNKDRAAKGSMTVSEWKQTRFYTQYPGFDVDVLDVYGNVMAGQTLLSTVRATYTNGK